MKRIVLIIALCVTAFVLGWLGKGMTEVPAKEKTELTNKQKFYRQQDSLLEISYPSYIVNSGKPDSKDRLRYLVADSYNFRFIVTGGDCTDADMADYSKHNKKTDSIMTIRVGKDWYQRFEKSSDSLYEIETLAESIAEKDIRGMKLIKNVLKDTSLHFYPQYKSAPTFQPKIKVVALLGEGRIYKDVTEVNYMRFFVDIEKEKVIKVDTSSYEVRNYSLHLF